MIPSSINSDTIQYPQTSSVCSNYNSKNFICPVTVVLNEDSRRTLQPRVSRLESRRGSCSQRGDCNTIVVQ